jgi:hypothetical protein
MDAGIDFGVEDETVLHGLSHIDALRRAVQDQTAPDPAGRPSAGTWSTEVHQRRGVVAP